MRQSATRLERLPTTRSRRCVRGICCSQLASARTACTRGKERKRGIRAKRLCLPLLWLCSCCTPTKPPARTARQGLGSEVGLRVATRVCAGIERTKEREAWLAFLPFCRMIVCLPWFWGLSARKSPHAGAFAAVGPRWITPFSNQNRYLRLIDR